MKKLVKEFSNRRGNIRVTFDGVAYDVQYTLYSNFKTGRPETIREFTDLDGVLAGEYFAAAKVELKGGDWCDPAMQCKYYRGTTRVCRRNTCPSRLGGAAYWDIFRATCPYKTR